MQEEKEIWKPVVGYEGYYEVSSFGNVRSVDRIITFADGRKVSYNGKMLKSILNNKGYYIVHLTKQGHCSKNFYVHRLVASSFLENPNNLPQVNHKDENPKNNNLSNIEYCDALYNSNYGNHNKHISLSIRDNPKRVKEICQFDLEGNLIRTYKCIRDVELYGFNEQNVSQCCRFEKFKTNHKRFLWLYKDESFRINEAVNRYKNKKSYTNKRAVDAYLLDGTYVGRFESQNKAGIALSINSSGISRCLNGYINQYKGYFFKYAE